MTSVGQVCANLRGDAGFYVNVAAFKCGFGKPRRLKSGLNVELMVDDVRNELRMGLGLVPASHDAESDSHLAAAHKCRDDGMQRLLSARQNIGTLRIEAEKTAAILEGKPGPRSDDTGPK